MAASAQDVADDSHRLDGVWQSIGYGYVLNIHGDEYAVYEVTSQTAVKSHEGKTASIDRELGDLSLDESTGRLSVSLPFTLTSIELRRIDSLPKVCLEVSDQIDPVTLFHIVWHTFNEQYAFFELRGVDWDAEYKKWRPQVTTATTDAKLFDILASMMSTLGDNHVMIAADDFQYAAFQRVPDFPLVRHWRDEYEAEQPDIPFIAFAHGKFEQYIATSGKLVAAQLTTSLKTGANDQLAWGMLPKQVGYLNVRSMAGYSKVEDDAAQFAALETALDQAIAELADTRAIIVDVRFNGGGWDNAALVVASRFADRKRAVLSKQARAGDTLTAPTTIYVEPDGPRQFTRPVVLLTSPMTVSAAEIFTYAMTAQPHVTHAGQPTMGIHSDMLERHLPGGWQFYLSNEVYRGADGQVREKIGIAPTHPIEMFTPDDFADGTDHVIDQAVGLAEAIPNK